MNLRLLDSNLLVINGFLFVSSCMLTIGGLSALPAAVRAAANTSGQSPHALPALKIEATPLPAGVMSDIASRLNRTYPGVKATIVGDKLKIAIADASAYSRWQAAIGDLLLTGDKNTIIETLSICGTHCAGDYCLAEFRPQRVRYVLTTPRLP